MSRTNLNASANEAIEDNVDMRTLMSAYDIHIRIPKVGTYSERELSDIIADDNMEDLAYVSSASISHQRGVQTVGELGSHRLFSLIDDGDHQLSLQRLIVENTILSAAYKHIYEWDPNLMVDGDGYTEVFDDFMIDLDENIFDYPLQVVLAYYNSRGELQAKILLNNAIFATNSGAVNARGRYAMEDVTLSWENTIEYAINQ